MTASAWRRLRLNVRLIPEATIDLWTGFALSARDNRVRAAAPTPAQQAADEPWDIAVAWHAKWFLIESKALRNDLRIEVPRDQLHLLESLEATGVPIYYGLPALTKRPFRPLMELRFQPEFDTWHRVVPPTTVASLLGGGRTLHASSLAGERTLREFLADVLSCREIDPTPARARPKWWSAYREVVRAEIQARREREVRRALEHDRDIFTLAVALGIDTR